MTYNIILSKKGPYYIARVKEWPEVVIREKTRQAALSRVKDQLIDYLAQQVEIIQIDLDPPAAIDNPWLKNFGRFKDDPTFADLQAEIAAYRQTMDRVVE